MTAEESSHPRGRRAFRPRPSAGSDPFWDRFGAICAVSRVAANRAPGLERGVGVSGSPNWSRDETILGRRGGDSKPSLALLQNCGLGMSQ